MKYIGTPMGMWLLFESSFMKNLTAVFGLSQATARAVMKDGKAKYKEIIRKVPAFEKGDRFQMNLVGAAMLAAVVLSMPERPDVERLTYEARGLALR